MSQEIFIAVVSGVVVAGVGAWLTLIYSIRQFRYERWWERRSRAYENLLAALHDSKAFSAAHLEAYEKDIELNEEKESEVRANAKAAHREIVRAFDIAPFLFSDEVVGYLRTLEKDIDAAQKHEEWFLFLQDDWSALNTAQQAIMKAAREELGDGPK